jgi:hypothetical protein
MGIERGPDMLPDSLLELAALAGRTMVAAVDTDVWPTAERGFVRLLGRGDEHQARLTEQRLEETRQRLTGAAGTDSEQARAALAERWAGRLADLLEESPDTEADLRALVQRIQTALPGGIVSRPDRVVATDSEPGSGAANGVAAAEMHERVGPPNPILEGSVVG